MVPRAGRRRYRARIGLSRQRAPFVPGQRLGRYELIEQLEVGDVAERWRARATPGEPVLVERWTVSPATTVDRGLQTRLLEDARALAPLRHAHLAPILAVSPTSEPAWLATAQRPGEELSVVVAKLIERGQRMPVAHALQLAIALASALHHIHESRAGSGRTLVHGHVAPSRVRLGHDGTIALLWGPAPSSLERLVYFSPEQRRGETFDRRSDIFALGALVYELTVGRRLHSEAAPAPPTTLAGGYDAPLEAILLRALDREPARRFPTARALQSALEAVAYDGLAASSATALAAWVRALVGSNGWDGVEVTRVERGRAAPAASSVALGHNSGPLDTRLPAWLPQPRPASAVGLSWRAAAALFLVMLTAATTAGVLRRLRRATTTTTTTMVTTTTAMTLPSTRAAARITAEPASAASERVPPPTPSAAGARPQGTLEVVSVPGGATLRLDGHALPERSPTRLVGIDAGAVHVLAVELGARGVTEQFVLQPDEDASLEIDLQARHRHNHKTIRKSLRPSPGGALKGEHPPKPRP